MMMHEVYEGADKRARRKRVGRGIGSGHGKTCGRGHKGAGSRSGHKTRLAFEGGQTSIFRRIAKRGFSAGRFARNDLPINLDQLSSAFNDGDTVDRNSLLAKGLLSGKSTTYKILAAGGVGKRLHLRVSGISQAAARLVIEAGGAVEIVG